MKKIALALACSIMAASAPLAPASAQQCGKIDWTYFINGEYMSGWEVIGFVENITGASGLSLQQAMQWLGRNGYRIVVIYRGCQVE